MSKRLFERTSYHVGDSDRCVQVLAAKDTGALADLLPVGSARAAIWVSRLSELTSHPYALAEYASAIQSATDQGKELFALYGGFFSVLLSCAGLGGSNHGIGFGEHRDWVQLPQSGPPPARYYLPQVHRYVSQEFAYQLWAG